MQVAEGMEPHRDLPGPVLVEGGHYTLDQDPQGEEIVLPDGTRWQAATTETTLQTFALAANEVATLRRLGTPARLGLLVGDIGLPRLRPSLGSWAIPASYRAVLDDTGLTDADTTVCGEAVVRNLGSRLLRAARRRRPEQTYAEEGWALFQDDALWRLASDASLEWEGDQRTAVLARASHPLCPLVFAGLKRAAFQAGFRTHVAIYAVPDDPWIDVKLRAAAAATAQLLRGPAGLAMDRLIRGPGLGLSERSWSRSDLVGPGERAWPEFLADLQRSHPGARPVEV